MKFNSMIILFILFSASNSSSDTLDGDQGTIYISPIVHASVQLEFGGYVVQVDPWGILGLDGLKPADLILTTDDVGHHLDLNAIENLRKPNAPVVVTANGLDRYGEGVVMNNGSVEQFDDVVVEAIPAYDIIPGEPSHPKGDANGYVLTIGGKRIYFAGVTECVAEVKGLKDIDVAFMPMNIPLGRMTPTAAAECTRSIRPKIVYPYHYDQGFERRLLQARSAGLNYSQPESILSSLVEFENNLEGAGIEVRSGSFYPR